MEEIWMPVVTAGGIYADNYDVSGLGRVRRRAGTTDKLGRSAPARVLFQGRCDRGYPFVRLVHEGKPTTLKVHRLVADAFLGPKPDHPNPHYWTVNHIDGDKTNNAVFNLERVTNKQNSRHAVTVIEGKGVEVFGVRLTLSEAVERFAVDGLPVNAVRRRVRRYGWSIERALKTPLLPTGRQKVAHA